MTKRDQRGFSLIEMSVTLAIVSVLMIVVYSMIDQTLRVTMFNESHNELTLMSQKAVNSIYSELVQTRMVFQENALGASYRGALQLSPLFPAWTDSLLPVVQTSTVIAPDTNTRFTGNSLLLARQLEPVSVTYDHDGLANTPEIQFLADVYQFEYVYLTRVTRPAFASSGYSLDLVMSTSIQYTDFFQLSGVGSGPALGRLVQKLIARGLTHAWDPGQPLATAFYTLAGATDGTFNAALANPRIDLATARTLLPGLRGGRISGRMEYSVGFGSYPLRTPIRLFAPVDAARPGFPSGFEIKIAGPTGSRQVMTRLVLMSHYGARHYESQQASAIIAGGF